MLSDWVQIYTFCFDVKYNYVKTPKGEGTMVSVNLKEWPNGKPLDEQQARHVQAMEIVKNEYRKRIKLD